MRKKNNQRSFTEVKRRKTIILVDHDNDNLNIADRIIQIGE